MNKIIIEVGSTNTKIDKVENNKITRLKEETILFKKHYQENNKIEEKDVEKLINCITNLKKEYKNFYICGTSIFRNLKENEKKEFLENFKEKTGFDFHIITIEEENKLTVLGATKNVKNKVCVFVGGGGSTEISIYEKNKIIESENTGIGVIDVMKQFPDLGEDIAKTDLEDVKKYIEERLNLPKEKADVLILAGGGHGKFARESGIRYEKNTLFDDENEQIMMDIKEREEDTLKFYKEMSLNKIREKDKSPDWWYATRAMCAFVLVVAEKIGAKYIIPTDISMVYGITKEDK